MKKIFRLIIILPFLLSGCFGNYRIGNKVDLDKMPQEASINDLNFKIDYDKNYSPKLGCKIIDSNWYSSRYFNDPFAGVYTYISALTLTIIPYYNHTIFGFKAKLVDVTSGKVLKEYKLEEIRYEWMWIGTIFTFDLFDKKKRLYSDVSDNGESLIREKIYKAFIGQVTNDAHQFVECRK
jgi:hypothetical protein